MITHKSQFPYIKVLTIITQIDAKVCTGQQVLDDITGDWIVSFTNPFNQMATIMQSGFSGKKATWAKYHCAIHCADAFKPLKKWFIQATAKRGLQHLKDLNTAGLTLQKDKVLVFACRSKTSDGQSYKYIVACFKHTTGLKLKLASDNPKMDYDNKIEFFDILDQNRTVLDNTGFDWSDFDPLLKDLCSSSSQSSLRS